MHISAVADFETNTVKATLTQGSAKAEITQTFEGASDFAAVEVLAVRSERNWEWSTEIDNMVFGMAK